MDLFEDLNRKMAKSGRKWRKAEKSPYRSAVLFCENCGIELGTFDMYYESPETHMYCSNCLKKYIKPVPYQFFRDGERIKTVVGDYGDCVDVRTEIVDTNYYSTISKTCYFSKKGRYIKINNKRFYL